MMGWAMAVLVEMVTLPFESVEVTGTGTATGVVGRLVIGAGKGVMTMLSDAGAGEFETTGDMAAAWGWNEVDAGACVGVGPSSGSVDVEVSVRYNAACNAAIGPAQRAADSQFQTPRPGKKFLIRFPVSPQVSSLIGTKVQPLGSSIVLTPMVCTPSGRSG